MSKKFWGTLLITLFFLVLSFHRVDFNELSRALYQANYWYLIPVIGAYFLGMFIRGFRWKTLLKPVKHVRSMGLAPVIIIGYTANNILPFRLGEFVRAYVVSRREKISKSSSLATIVVERIFDGLTMLLFLAVVSAYHEFPGWGVNIIRITSVIFGGCFIFFLVLIIKRTWFKTLIDMVISMAPLRYQPIISKLCQSFIDGLEVLKSVSDVIKIMIWSILVWIVEGSMFYLLMESFRPLLPAGLSIPFYAPLMTVAILNLGIMIPSSPGFVGPFEWFCINTLLLFSVPREIAASYTIVLHAAQFIPITIVGLILLAREGVHLAELHSLDGEIS